MSEDSRSRRRRDAAVGCVAMLGSVSLTCLLLFFNASLVMAMLTATKTLLPDWARKPELTQFLLFLVPVLLVIAQWMLIDLLRSRFRRANY